MCEDCFLFLYASFLAVTLPVCFPGPLPSGTLLGLGVFEHFMCFYAYTLTMIWPRDGTNEQHFDI